MSETPEDQVVDAAFFGNILETDLANIAKKATSGQPLTSRERKMIEDEQTRLEKSQPAFILEGEGPVTALQRMTQKELALAWDVSLRTIKGWTAEGKAKGDPVPLTRPDDLPAWYARMHAPRQCPEGLRLAAVRLSADEKAAVPANIAELPKAPVERIFIADEEKGLLAMLERHRTAEAELHAKYMAAVDAGEENKANFFMAEWSKMGEKLRALEKVAPKALEDLGIYVRRDEIQRELEPLHRAIIKAFRQGLRMSRPRLKLAENADDWNRIVDNLVDEILQMLAGTDFSEPLVLTDEAA